jgi:diguanylate cyclase (GGDEF)-like protein
MHDEKFYTAMWQALQREKYWSGEVWDKRKDGSIYPKRLTINAVTNSKGQVTNYVAAFTDITQVKEAQEDIYRLAFFDALTNLPNRRLLLDRLKRAIVVSNRNHLCGAVLFIDLDNFKSLNDTQGHDFGDLMLIEVTRRVQDCLRENDTVARLGGDEFVVMLEGLSKLTEQAATLTQLVAEKICNAINQPYFLKGHEYHSSASIGISMFCGNNVSIEELLKHADTAMYQAKQSGRNTLRFFDPSMQAALETRAALEADLRQALSQNQFKLYYQIQVNSNRRIFGAEVLLRWQHSERGLVGPMEFIPLAEETGLILPIGKYVLEAACKQLKAWEGKPHTRHLVLAVNISGVQFQQPGFIEEVRTVLNQTGAHPELLKLELTESLVIDIDEAIKKMQTLRSLGVEFSMDDFGTGYSSLASLKLLPLAQLKIDRSFVRDITTDANDAVIVKTIIGMANTLELEVIAEGVETEEQLKLLKQYRCRFFQGYLFSEPLPLEALEQLLKQPVKSQRKIVQA